MGDGKLTCGINGYADVIFYRVGTNVPVNLDSIFNLANICTVSTDVVFDESPVAA